MKHGINIRGGRVEKQAVEAVADAVVTVFNAAYETRMDQETVRSAIEIVSRMGVVEGTTITNSTFTGGGY